MEINEFTQHELETIFHVFSNLRHGETNQMRMIRYERIANKAINKKGQMRTINQRLQELQTDNT